MRTDGVFLPMEFLPAVRSIPDIFEKLYGKNKFLALLAALMTIVIPIGTTCSQLLAFAKIYTAITGLPVSVLVIIFAIVAFLLVLPGGLKSVAWTDAIMGCLMLVFSFLTAFYALHTAGGWSAVVAAMPADKIAFPSGMVSVGWFTVWLWMFSALPGSLTTPMYYQRVFAIGDPKAARKSLLLAAIVSFTAILWSAVMGFSIHALNPDLASENATGWYITQLPLALMVVFATLITTTILTTTSSTVQTACVTVSKDIYQKLSISGRNDNCL